jgi:hypothetical protein
VATNGAAKWHMKCVATKVAAMLVCGNQQSCKLPMKFVATEVAENFALVVWATYGAFTLLLWQPMVLQSLTKYSLATKLAANFAVWQPTELPSCL